MNRVFLVLFLTAASLSAYSADPAQAVFVRSRCDKKLSSIVISALKEAITASGKYRLVSSLDDEGKLDLVHTI